MSDSENPYAAPQSPAGIPPLSQVSGVVWILLQIAMVIAIAIAVILLGCGVQNQPPAKQRLDSTLHRTLT